MATEILAIITAALGALGALISLLKERKKDKELRQAKLEMSFTKTAIDFGTFLEEWEGTYHHINRLMNDTKLDRFMILRAWNGIDHPKWTTAVLQIREGAQEPVSYVHYELDSDYVKRLQETKLHGMVCYATADLPLDSGIRKIYEAEGVKHSIWGIVDEQDGPGGTKAVTYCSLATHRDEPFTDSEKVHCNLLLGRMKGLRHNFYVANNQTK